MTYLCNWWWFLKPKSILPFYLRYEQNDLNLSCAFAFVFNEWKEIKIFEAFVVQKSISLSSEP